MPRPPRKPTATVTALRPDAKLERRRIPHAVLEYAHPRPADRPPDPFVFADHPPGVRPSEEAAPGLAQDEAFPNAAFAWAAQNSINSAFAEGVTFLGYAYLSALAQRPEYRVISETIASEMTREWIELKSTGEDDKTDKIKALVDAIEALGVREVVREAIEGDGFFGRGHIYLDTGDTDDRDELKKSIGDGRDFASRLKVGKRYDDGDE